LSPWVSVTAAAVLLAAAASTVFPAVAAAALLVTAVSALATTVDLVFTAAALTSASSVSAAGVLSVPCEDFAGGGGTAPGWGAGAELSEDDCWVAAVSGEDGGSRPSCARDAGFWLAGGASRVPSSNEANGLV
jgi:hypothetical protein